MKESAKPWWELRWVHIMLVVIAALPLLYPGIPPLIDLPGHMGRYAVQLNTDPSSPLHQFYDFNWELIGNLGVDLLIIPVSKLFGLELGTKLIVIAIPVVATIGLLWIAREVHGRVLPTTLLALPLVYGYPLIYGFVNYSLSMALALVAYALWIRLGRLGHLRLRAVLFLLIAPMLWIAHIFGWAVLCLLCGMTEIVNEHSRRGRWPAAVVHAVVLCLPLAPPFLLMLFWRSGNAGGGNWGWFNVMDKLRYVAFLMRDRWLIWDLWCAALVYGVAAAAAIVLIWRSNLLGYSRRLLAAGLVLLAFYILLPNMVFGSAFAEMRLLPYAFMVLFLSLRPGPAFEPRAARIVAMGAIVFLLARAATLTASFAIEDRRFDEALVALDHVPEGARMLSLVRGSCSHRVGMPKVSHLPALAIIRRKAFSNDQWDRPGAQLLRSRHPQGNEDAIYFSHDPSQMVSDVQCPNSPMRTIDWALQNFPRGQFDYLWLIDVVPADAVMLRGMTRVWSGGRNSLYRIDDHRPLAQIATDPA